MPVRPVFELLLAVGVPVFETCLFMLFAPFSIGLSKRALYPFKVFFVKKEESISVLNGPGWGIRQTWAAFLVPPQEASEVARAQA